MKQYDVFMSGKNIGNVNVTKEGLYYVFHCRCDLPDSEIFRLFAENGKQVTDFGVLVPGKEGYTLLKKIPVKKFGEEPLSFRVTSQKQQHAYVSIPVFENRAFDYISKLTGARMHIDKGNYYILFQE